MIDTDTDRASCALCDRPDTLGTGLCPACLATASGRRTLVFVGGTDTGDAVLRLFGSATGRRTAQAALRAGRPLVAVPAGAAARLLEALEAKGIPARGIPAGLVWRALPVSFGVLLLAVLAGGTIAGLIAEPVLLRASPVLALLLLWLELRSLGRPVLVPDDASLPGPLRADVAATLARLEAGPARERLVDLLRLARPALERIDAQGDPARLRRSIHELIRAACDTAREMDRLTRTSDVIRSSLVWTTELAGEKQAGSARRALLRAGDLAANGLARMADAVAALGRVDAGTATLNGRVGTELAELTRGLQAAARVPVETVRELNRLVA